MNDKEKQSEINNFKSEINNSNKHPYSSSLKQFILTLLFFTVMFLLGSGYPLKSLKDLIIAGVIVATIKCLSRSVLYLLGGLATENQEEHLARLTPAESASKVLSLAIYVVAMTLIYIDAVVVFLLCIYSIILFFIQ